MAKRDDYLKGTSQYTPVYGYCQLKVTTILLPVLGRKTSSVKGILAIQFNPENSNDEVEEEKVMTILRRNVTLHSENEHKE